MLKHNRLKIASGFRPFRITAMSMLCGALLIGPGLPALRAQWMALQITRCGR